MFRRCCDDAGFCAEGSRLRSYRTALISAFGVELRTGSGEVVRGRLRYAERKGGEVAMGVAMKLGVQVEKGERADVKKASAWRPRLQVRRAVERAQLRTGGQRFCAFCERQRVGRQPLTGSLRAVQAQGTNAMWQPPANWNTHGSSHVGATMQNVIKRTPSRARQRLIN
jgi:hypothetical protein